MRGNRRDCTRDADTTFGEPIGNKYPDPSKCTDPKFPICYLSNSPTTAGFTNSIVNMAIQPATALVFACVQCRADCDCDPGHACQVFFNQTTDNIDTFGTCVKVAEIYGKTCDPNLQTTNQRDLKYGSMEPARGCFYVISEDNIVPSGACSNGNPTCYRSLRTGSCIEGKCRECDSTFVLSEANALSTIKVTDQFLPATTCATTTLRGPRVCRNFKSVLYSSASSLSSSTKILSITLLLFVVFLF